MLRKIIYKITFPFVKLYWRMFKPQTYGSRALLIHEDKVLLVKNINSRHWSFPGGQIEKGEAPEECLVRELKEELDLTISQFDFKLGKYLSQQEGKKDTIHIYVINLLSLHFSKQWELEEAKWFLLNSLPQDISPATKRRIDEFSGGQKNLTKSW